MVRDNLVVVTFSTGTCDSVVGGYAYWNGRGAVVVIYGGLDTGWFAQCDDIPVYRRMSLYVLGAVQDAQVETVGGAVFDPDPILPSGSKLGELLLLPSDLPFYAG